MEYQNIVNLTLEEKVGQLFFIGLPGPEIDSVTEALLEKVKPGGICLFSRNIKTAEQTRKLIEDVNSLSPLPPLISIDQEGGMVDRLRRIVTPMPAANEFNDAAETGKFGALNGEILRLLGFNMNFAPVVDVIGFDRQDLINGLRSRSFGTSVDEVCEMAGSFLSAMEGAQVIGCLKHFPGLGAAEVDSHEELPVVKISRDEFTTVDLVPYERMLAGDTVKAVMVAHAAYPELDLQESDAGGRLVPASLSKNLISGLLRKDLGFEGVVITDDLEMGAIVRHYGIGDACEMALRAGVDMLAICADPVRIDDGYSRVLGAVRRGEISEERIDISVARIRSLRDSITERPELDPNRLSDLSEQISFLKDSLKKSSEEKQPFA